MRKSTRIALVLLLLILSAVPTAVAQSLTTGINLLQQSKTLQQTNQTSAYSRLWQAYQLLSSVTPANDNEKTQLRNALTEMHPLIMDGFVYNSTKGERNNAILFGQALLDIEDNPLLSGIVLEHGDKYPTLIYNTAAYTFNRGDYTRVIRYFKAYLRTGDGAHRRDVINFMMNACNESKDYASAMEILDEFVAYRSNDPNAIKKAINICMETGNYGEMQKYLTRALSSHPNDQALQRLQAQAYEETQQFEKALELYERQYNSNPQALDLAKHVAVNKYNIAAQAYNLAQTGNNAKKNQKLAETGFQDASRILEKVVQAEPNSLKYYSALAQCYLFSGQNDKLQATNARVQQLGGVTASTGDKPMTISVKNQTASAAASASTSLAAAASTTSSNVVVAATPSSDEVRPYSEYAKEYVENQLKEWQAKDPYETVEEYRQRVNEKSRQEKTNSLLQVAKDQYIATYGSKALTASAMTLRPYDAENQVFLVESPYGEMVVPVPRQNNEARSFEMSWKGMQFTGPQYNIIDDKLMLTALTFTTPTGKSYQFKADGSLAYTETQVDIQFEKLDDKLFAQNGNGRQNAVKRDKKTINVGTSDVDIDIPVAKKENPKTFAVIICNENYSMVSTVPMALNDGRSFAEYCKKTLGMPEDNVRLYNDASYGVMLRAMHDISAIASAYQGDINVLFYYAGHGIPNESTKDAFLLPIDADGTHTEGCYSLSRLYAELGGLNAKSVVVFLDACFSGAKRDGGMLASARGVALKAKAEDPRGNMVIFSAASDDETAMPYKEKNHGLFTYFLLKKLQQSKGDVTLSELGDYITKNVRQQSTVVNRKSQTPSVVPSTAMADTWKTLKLNY